MATRIVTGSGERALRHTTRADRGFDLTGRALVVILACALACASERPAKHAAPGPEATESADDPPPPESPSPPPASNRSDAGAGGDEGVEAMLAELDEEPAGIREVPGCNTLRGKDDCVEAGKVMLGCVGLGNVLRAEPTQALVECLQKLNGSEAMCDATALETCGLPAIDAVPASETSRTTCRRIFARCGAPEVHADLFTEARCASGLAAARRRSGDDFAECMLERCDLKLCLSGVL